MNFSFRNPYTGQVGNVHASTSAPDDSQSAYRPSHDNSQGLVAAQEAIQGDKKPFEGLVIVLSGIENPERGQVRQRIIDLGGEYSANWTSRSTHLISAFKKTPKVDQMIGK